jgi:NDP-sugar pyrophosphorylase family protein
VVVGYLKEQIIQYLKDGSSLGVRIIYKVQNNIGFAEEAIRAALPLITSQYVLCICADDLITTRHLNQLIANLKVGADGAILVKRIGNLQIPRLMIGDGGKIIGISHNKQNPIMIYNFVIKTQVLMEWIAAMTGEGRPLVCSINQVLANYTLLAVEADDLFTINTLEQLNKAEQFLGSGGCHAPHNSY